MDIIRHFRRASHQPRQVVSRDSHKVERTRNGKSELLFSLEGIDISRRQVERDVISGVIPHRGDMLLLDYIAWTAEDSRSGLAVKQVRGDEFWVPGHFPGCPIMPGVLMIEAGAQMALYLCNRRLQEHAMGLFLRIEDARFRASATPGDELLILGSEVEHNRNVFRYNVQGLLKKRIAFDGRIVGMLK